LLLEPDLLGFRRALCAGQERAAPIDAAAVALVRDLIPLDRRSRVQPTPVAADYRVLSARGYALDPKDSGDRIFVRDLVLPVRVGAYASEREKPQNVRFDVEVSVTRPAHAVGDMRDVLSYDVITDGIRILAAKEHVALVETLAEQVAAFVLAHPRAVAVMVRVEKLDLGPGGVGVEIRRERQGDTAKVFQLFSAAADKKTRD
jgi:dihydroneopterin aldolase